MSDSVLLGNSEREWAAFAAIDWADQKHFWRLVPAGSPPSEGELGELENTPEAVEQWAMALERRFGGQPIAVCLEQMRGGLVYMLTKYAHLVLFPVPPTTAARYRQTFCTSGAKDDPSDTASLLDLLLRHPQELSPLQPDTTETRLLHFLVERRRQLVDEKTRHNNRLVDCLKLYFPQVVHWFNDVSTPVVGALLERWSSLQDLQRAHPGTLRKFFNEQHCRGQEKIQQRITAIYQAIPATQDVAVLEAGAITARGLVATLATLRSNIEELDRRIAQLVASHPEAPLFDSLPGAGAALVPRLIVAFGTRRERFDNAYQMQCYSGVAPVKQASGRTQRVLFRFACPKFLRQTFQEFASHSIGQSEWARAYYQLQRDRHKSHHAAVRALAFKWIRIIFRCWKERKPYDEQEYLESSRRRGSLLGRTLAAATNPKRQANTASGLKTIADILKFSENPS